VEQTSIKLTFGEAPSPAATGGNCSSLLPAASYATSIVTTATTVHNWTTSIVKSWRQGRIQLMEGLFSSLIVGR